MKRKVLNIIMAGIMTLSVPMTAFAADNTYTEDGTAAVLLSAEVNMNYTVSLPASLVLEDEDGDSIYEGSGTVSVKGVIPKMKAVVVVPSQGEMSGGTLTDESVSDGESAASAITTDSLNSLTEDYVADVKIKGTEKTNNSEVTGQVSQQYVRFASSYLDTALADHGEAKLNSDGDTFVTSPVNFSVAVENPDTYTGTIAYTFKLVTRS